MKTKMKQDLLKKKIHCLQLKKKNSTVTKKTWNNGLKPIKSKTSQRQSALIGQIN